MGRRVAGKSTLRQRRSGSRVPSGPRTPDAKIFPPELPPACVARPALENRLDEVFDHRVAVVVAGAGFGKSTLVAQWARRNRVAWYSVDSADCSLAVLARGLESALRAQLPGVRAGISTAARSAREEAAQAESLAWLLVEELDEELRSDLVLVVDDVHELPPRGPSARLLETLCRVAPRRLHLVVCARSRPPFAIARMRARGELLLLEGSSLAFSRDEVAAVIESAVGAESTRLADRLHALTGGWPAAVRLALEALRGDFPVPDDAVIDGLRGGGGALFEYLAEEVFAHQRADVIEFLRRVSPFERFTPELCTAIGVRDVRAMVARLSRSGLLVQAQGPDGWHTLHGLVRRFTIERWPLDETELPELHRRAATWFESCGEWAEALRSWQGATDWLAISRLLSDRGAQLVNGGAVEQLLDAVDQLPDELRGPDVLELAGEALHYRGDWQGALSYYAAAAGGADPLAPSLARRLGFVHYLREEFDEALRIYGRAAVDEREPAEEARLLAHRSMAHFRRSEGAACRHSAVRSLEVATGCGDSRALADAHMAMATLAALEGNREAIEPHQLAALAAAERAGDAFQLMRLHMNRSVYLGEEGRYEDTLSELEEGMRLADLLGFTDFQAIGIGNRGDAWRALGRLEEAVADYERAKAIFQRTGSGMLVFPLGRLARTYRERGDLALARAAYEQVREMAERAGDFAATGISLSGLARTCVTDSPDDALGLAEAALDHAQGLARVNVLVDVGWVVLARGDHARARALANEAAAAARDQHDRAGLGEALELRALAETDRLRSAAFLGEAIAIWRQLGNPLDAAKAEFALAAIRGNGRARPSLRRLEQHLHRLGIRVRSAAEAAGLLMQIVPRGEPAIAIRALGGFRLVRDGTVVSASAWQSKKARDVLKILVAARSRPVTRDALMEALWPEEDPEKATNRLSVALSTVRTVLDPAHRFPADHYVVATKEAVALRRVVVDVESFFAEAEAGLATRTEGGSTEATELLEAAEEAYTGDFLEEDAYEDWAAPVREEARAAYLAVAGALAEEAAAAGNFDSAVRYRLRVLERDRYDEGAHLGLITALTTARRHGEARRAYGGYVARMEEIGVEPAPFPSSKDAPSPTSAFERGSA